MLEHNEPIGAAYFTSGQVAKILKISVSTLKRWLEIFPELTGGELNASGWRLFSESDLNTLRDFKRQRRRKGRMYRPSTLAPIPKEGN